MRCKIREFALRDIFLFLLLLLLLFFAVRNIDPVGVIVPRGRGGINISSVVNNTIEFILSIHVSTHYLFYHLFPRTQNLFLRLICPETKIYLDHGNGRGRSIVRLI